MLLIRPKVRNDAAGNGDYGSRRGGRSHNGIDFDVPEGSIVLSPVDGVVTKHGYCYADDLAWRYIEVTSSDKYRHRLFYTTLLDDVRIRLDVKKGQALGLVQAISKRYPDQAMRDHVHYEIMAPGQLGHINPRDYHNELNKLRATS